MCLAAMLPRPPEAAASELDPQGSTSPNPVATPSPTDPGPPSDSPEQDADLKHIKNQVRKALRSLTKAEAQGENGTAWDWVRTEDQI